MKKKFLFSLVALILSACLLAFVACGGSKFELSAETERMTVTSGERFTVTVKTKNVGKDYSYRGSSTVLGAGATLYAEVDGERVELTCEPFAVNADIGEVTISTGDEIVNQWVFYARTHIDRLAPSDGEPAPKGSYTLVLRYLNSERVIKNFITVI